MTVHRLHAGDGYTYLTRQTISADRELERGEALAEYYTAEGCPPGTWWGAGSEAMGMSGEVTEAHMLALFGEGLRPDADAIIAREIEAGKSVDEAIKAAKLGKAFPQFGGKDTPITARMKTAVRVFVEENKRLPTQVERAVLRTDAAREHLSEHDGGKPSKAAIEEALAAEKRGSREAVAGFDCVFTPSKSFSLLWAFGDAEMAAMVERWHNLAVTESLEMMQAECAKTRRGKGSVRQIDAIGLSVVRFDHRDNRAGDPNLHTHCGVSAKVQGVDGTWSSLDARSLYKFGVPLSTSE